MALAHGPDTEELLRRIANIHHDILDVCRLNITSLPELPSTLMRLDCSDTQLSVLPKLPSELKYLECANTQIITLPAFPSTLRILICANTQISILPELPSELKLLYCENTQLTVLPELPSGLQYLNCFNTPLIIQREEYESIQNYSRRWREWREEQVSKKRVQERSNAIKRDLVANVWHPRRVEKLLDAGFEELVF